MIRDDLVAGAWKLIETRLLYDLNVPSSEIVVGSKLTSIVYMYLDAEVNQFYHISHVLRTDPITLNVALE